MSHPVQYEGEVDLDGVLWQRIVNIKNAMAEAHHRMLLHVDAYFQLIKSGAWESPDLKREGKTQRGIFLHEWTFSINELKTKNLYKKEYEEQKLFTERILPYWWEYLQKEEDFPYEDHLIFVKEASKRWVGGGYPSVLKKIFPHTDKSLVAFRTSMREYLKEKRIREMELEVWRSLQVITPIGTFNCHHPEYMPSERKVFELKEKMEGEREKYGERLDYERRRFEGKIIDSITPYPLRYELLELPERPQRKSVEQVEKESLNEIPPLSRRDANDREKWCVRRVLLREKYRKIKEDAREKRVTCSSSPDAADQYYECSIRREQYERALHNWQVLDALQYPEEIEKDLVVVPSHDPSDKNIRKYELQHLLDYFDSYSMVGKHEWGIKMQRFVCDYGHRGYEKTEKAAERNDVLMLLGRAYEKMHDPNETHFDLRDVIDSYKTKRDRFREKYGHDPSHMNI